MMVICYKFGIFFFLCKSDLEEVMTSFAKAVAGFKIYNRVEEIKTLTFYEFLHLKKNDLLTLKYFTSMFV